MAQSTDNTLSNQSGASFRTELNSILGAHLSSHKGGSEPSYITTGAFWIDDTSTPWVYKIYDGAASFGFMEFNPSTNNVTLINVKDGDARTEGASIGQIQDCDFNLVSSVSGTNTITGNLTPAITAYVEGLQIAFNPAGANTGAATIDLNSIGAAKALQINGQALVGGELATTDYVKAIYDGTAFQIVSPTSKQPLKGVRFPDQGELTISSGAVTITGANHTIDTESDAASDDLDTINGAVDGAVLVLRAANAARTVVIKHNTGNIVTPDGEDITLDETRKTVVLQYDAELTSWLVLSAPPAGGGAMELLGSYTANNVTSVDIGDGLDLDAVIDGTYDEYIIKFNDVKLTNSSQHIDMRFSTDGTTFDPIAGNYAFGLAETRPSDAAVLRGAASDNAIQLWSGASSDISANSNGEVTVYRTGSNSTTPALIRTVTRSASPLSVKTYHGSGIYAPVQEIQAIRLFATNGNISSGNFYLYGVRKS